MKKNSLLLAIIMLVSLCIASCGSKPTDTPFAPGTTNENGYTSDWMGLSFKPTEDMEMMSAEELEMLMQAGGSIYTTDEATGEEKLDYSKIPTAYEMVATDTQTQGSVLIMAQYADEEMTVDAYIEGIKEQFDGSFLADNGMSEPTYSELANKKLAGREYTVFSYTFDEDGFGQTMYIAKIEDRIANICFTHGSSAELDGFLACFGKN